MVKWATKVLKNHMQASNYDVNVIKYGRQNYREQFICGYEGPTKATPLQGVQIQPPQLFAIWLSAETLYEPRRELIDPKQTIGDDNNVWRLRLRSVLKMGPNQRAIKRGVNVKAASMQLVEVEKEASMKRPVLKQRLRPVSNRPKFRWIKHDTPKSFRGPENAHNCPCVECSPCEASTNTNVLHTYSGCLRLCSLSTKIQFLSHNNQPVIFPQSSNPPQ